MKFWNSVSVDGCQNLVIDCMLTVDSEEAIGFERVKMPTRLPCFQKAAGLVKLLESTQGSFRRESANRITMKVYPVTLLVLCGSEAPAMAKKNRRLGNASTKAPKTSKSEACGKGTRAAGLSLLTDNHGDETGWALQDSAGNELLSVDYPTYEDNTQYDVDFGCLNEDDCYEFTIFDCYGDGLDNGYTVTFGDETFPGSSFDGDEQTIEFGDTCTRRLELSTQKSFHHVTFVKDDDRTVVITISVEKAQNIHVEILDREDPEDVVEQLWNGLVSPEEPIELSFNAENIHVPTYLASITSQDTGSSVTYTLKKKF